MISYGLFTVRKFRIPASYSFFGATRRSRTGDPLITKQRVNGYPFEYTRARVGLAGTVAPAQDAYLTVEPYGAIESADNRGGQRATDYKSDPVVYSDPNANVSAFHPSTKCYHAHPKQVIAVKVEVKVMSSVEVAAEVRV